MLLPDLLVFVAPASRSNAILIERITYDVAIMDPAMFLYGISAANHLVAFPSVDFTMEELLFGRFPPFLPKGTLFHKQCCPLASSSRLLPFQNPPGGKLK